MTMTWTERARFMGSRLVGLRYPLSIKLRVPRNAQLVNTSFVAFKWDQWSNMATFAPWWLAWLYALIPTELHWSPPPEPQPIGGGVIEKHIMGAGYVAPVIGAPAWAVGILRPSQSLDGKWHLWGYARPWGAGEWPTDREPAR